MKLVINPDYEYLKDFLHKLPENFNREGDIIYAERNIIKKIETGKLQLSVKSFHVPFFINRIVYTFFRLSKARRSYEYGLRILNKGIGTPTPVAYIENKTGGLLNDSYFVYLYKEYTGMMREFRSGKLEGREDLLTSFAQFAAYIHKQDVLHKDFSPGNILYDKIDNNYYFYLIDINRMEFGPVDIERGCANLSRLWGNNEMIEFIAREYAIARNFDVNECIRLTFKFHKAFWDTYARRHNGFKPYLE